jgi:hypothetical protein
MDEGLNSYYERRCLNQPFPPKKGSKDTTDQEPSINLANILGKEELDEREIAYYFQARRHREQHITLPAPTFPNINYGVMNYMKVPLFLDYMEDFLGTDLMDQTMQKYYQKWKFKHPSPEDLRATFEKTGKEVSWFFDHVLSNTWKLDYSLTDISEDTIHIGGSHTEVYADTVITAPNVYRELTIESKGGIKGPYPVSGLKDGEVVETVWYGGFAGEMKVLFPEGDYDTYKIDAKKQLPEINRKNNTIKKEGWLRKTEKLRLQPLLSLHNGDRTELVYVPLVGWNNYDKTMIGMGFYNSLLFANDFEYVLAPMYGIGSNSVNGFARLAYNWYPNNSRLFKSIRFETSGQSFSEGYYRIHKSDNDVYLQKDNLKYYKFSPSVTFNFKRSSARQKIDRKLTLRNVQIYKKQTHCTQRGQQDKVCRSPLSTSNYMINEIEYHEKHKRTINPFEFTINLQQGTDFLKTYGEGKYHVNYNGNKGLDIRIFGGTFAYLNKTPVDVRFQLNGRAGSQDYKYDHLYLDRHSQDPILGRQISRTDGAFKTNAMIGETSEWIASLNLKTDLPFTQFLKVFADAGTYHGAGTDLHPYSQPFAYNTGVILTPGTPYVEVYVPFLMSKGIQGNAQFYERITFSVQLHRLDIFNMARNADLSLGN